MAFDIVMRNAGTAFDIAMLDAASASFTGESSFNATTTFAQVASVKAEAIAALDNDAHVASVKVEAIANLDSDAHVASVKVEAIANLDSDAHVASCTVERVAARPLDPYAPYNPGGGGGAGLCTGFSTPTSGFAYFGGSSSSCCDGFYMPQCGGGSTPGTPELLAFEKDTSDEVLLCTRGPLSGYYPTGALSVFVWSRPAAFDGAGQIPIINAMTSSLGWRLAYGGASNTDEVDIQYRDTGATLRSDVHAFSGGDLLAAGWRALGGFRAESTPWAQRAFVDDEVGLSTNGTVAPQSGGRDAITLFGVPGGDSYQGLMLCPLFIAADLGSGGSTTWQQNYFDDLGERQSSIYSNGNLLLAPRADSTVAAGDPVRVWTVDQNDDEVSGPTVYGTPAYWKGPWWGLLFEDIHWIQMPWVSSSLAAGRTLILAVEGASTPAANQYVVGRLASGAGGAELIMLNTDGVDARAILYDATGGAVLTLTLSITTTLGDLIFYALRIGAGGTASCSLSAYGTNGNQIGTTSGTPSAAAVLNQDQRWGRHHTSGSAYTAGTCYRWVEFASSLTDQQIADYILQTGTPPSAARDVRGVNGNVVDDGDPVKLWGPYDSTGTYGSQILFTGIGSDQIVVGS